ncbi:protein D2-like [Argiope bruennichi]|uniref:protein D2-like n=1 Tax=Argiope bruennichi TaxID=94029 RepID=UPI00249590B4|nr:protein D2-like [Argiope bruennichi]
MAYKLIFWTILVFFVGTEAQKSQCDLNKFQTSNIVPTLIAAVPPNSIQIEYQGQPVTCGNTLTLNLTRDRPSVVDYKADVNKLYTLIMFDPDFPDPKNPISAHFLHWLMENIPENLVINGDTVLTYSPPASTGSGPHRHIFLVYEQPNREMLNDDDKNTGVKRNFFDLNQFVKDRNLKGPIAGNFFLSLE